MDSKKLDDESNTESGIQAIMENDEKKFETVETTLQLQQNVQSTVAHPHYVGLINHSMTCYLNSLVQALFMTPEFRNAIYRCEFNIDNDRKSIIYQLQRLFLKLQTSKESAIETTDLIQSFGWDSAETLQQQDIQELCRIMFNALEQKFVTTNQPNLISNLYEGKMLDYVKCLECQTEKTRADKFLDIPLPVRPFGSNVGYGSIEEALRAFVQPETLDGNNQYFCEKCNKKCDAHKGLKFSDFPYILTLHLKRFEFDHQTLDRIKLNDVVTFPETLNLNSFIFEDILLADRCYTYELFAIMVHSGSAAGGHYYAYIKDFNSSSWFCFNDESVTPITKEDIEDSYGGTKKKNSSKDFGDSSMNAYMLMYRHVDMMRNESTMAVEEFKPHLKSHLQRLQMEDGMRYRHLIQQCPPVKLLLPKLTLPRIYFYNPEIQKLTFTCAYITRSATFHEILTSAYYLMDAHRFAPISRCRLVAFDHQSNEIVQSFEDPAVPSISEVMAGCDGAFCFLLEFYEEGQKLEIYRPGGATWYVYKIVLSTMEMFGPFLVYSQSYQHNDILRESIAIRMRLKSNEFLMATLLFNRVFIACDPAPTPSAEKNLINFVQQHFLHLVHFYVNIPYITISDLEVLGISTENLQMNSTFARHLRGLSHQKSNNEDDVPKIQIEFYGPTDQKSEADGYIRPLYFFAIPIKEVQTFHSTLAVIMGQQNTQPNTVNGQGNSPTGFGLKIITDSRMSMDDFKRHLQPYIGLSSDYFELKREPDTTDPLSLGRSLVMIQDNEVITLELGKYVMSVNEFKTTISYMRLKDLNNESGPLQTICTWYYVDDMKVADAKKELVAKFHRLDPKKYSTLTVETCRLWLKGVKNPLKILADNSIMADEICATMLATDFLIQEVEPGQSTQPPPENGVVVFARQWHPDTMILDGFEEITLTRETEIREAISQLSDIPKEHIAYIKLSSSFPCTEMSLLTLNITSTWLTIPATLKEYPLNTIISGNVFVYKDVRIRSLELNFIERYRWLIMEKNRLERLGYFGLKIYFEAP